MVGNGLVEVHGHLEEEVPHAQVAAEQARRLEPETLQYIISHMREATNNQNITHALVVH